MTSYYILLKRPWYLLTLPNEFIEDKLMTNTALTISTLIKTTIYLN